MIAKTVAVVLIPESEQPSLTSMREEENGGTQKLVIGRCQARPNLLTNATSEPLVLIGNKLHMPPCRIHKASIQSKAICQYHVPDQVKK